MTHPIIPTADDPVEAVPAVIDAAPYLRGQGVEARVSPAATPAVVTPTQLRRPWRATIRTWFEALVAASTLLPLVAAEVYDDPADTPAAVAQAVIVCGIVARVMAMPAVEMFLRRYVPWLAAAPAPPHDAYPQPIDLEEPAP